MTSDRRMIKQLTVGDGVVKEQYGGTVNAIRTVQQYGFVHYLDTPVGLTSAMNAVNALGDLVVDDVHFTCTVSRHFASKLGEGPLSDTFRSVVGVNVVNQLSNFDVDRRQQQPFIRRHTVPEMVPSSFRSQQFQQHQAQFYAPQQQQMAFQHSPQGMYSRFPGPPYDDSGLSLHYAAQQQQQQQQSYYQMTPQSYAPQTPPRAYYPEPYYPSVDSPRSVTGGAYAGSPPTHYEATKQQPQQQQYYPVMQQQQYFAPQQSAQMYAVPSLPLNMPIYGQHQYGSQQQQQL
eukprot:gene28935-35889_t